MPTKKLKHNKKNDVTEKDSVYFLKLTVYVMLGLFWVHFAQPVHVGGLVFYGVPLGLVIGLLLASHDHFQVDRKLEYAVLIIMTIIGFVYPYLGIFI